MATPRKKPVSVKALPVAAKEADAGTTEGPVSATIDEEQVRDIRNEFFEGHRRDNGEIEVKPIGWIGEGLRFHESHLDELIQILKKF